MEPLLRYPHRADSRVLCSADGPRDTSLPACGFEDVVRRLLAHGVDRRDNEETGDLGEHRRIDDAEVACPVNDEVRIEDAALRLVADGTGAGGVMAPGVV